MNILFVSEFVPQTSNPEFKGGVQTRTYYIANRLKEKNNVDIISLNIGNIEASPFSLFYRIIFFFKIIFRRFGGKPDILEASNTTTYFPSFIYAKRIKIPAVAWVPDVLGEQWEKNFSFSVAKAGKILEKLGLTLPWDHYIAMSQVTKSKLINLGINREKISVVYGGVDSTYLKKLKVNKYKKPTICVISRFLPYKRVEDVIKAVKIIENFIPQIRCIIIGEGPEKNNLISLISKLSLENSITIISNLKHDKVMRILKRSHVFCLPSTVEGFGLVTIESMATGVPYVNSDISQTIEITKKGMGGLLFSRKDERDLSEKIIRLLSNEDLYNKKVKQGLKLAKLYDWDIIAEQSEKIYKKVIHKRRYQ